MVHTALLGLLGQFLLCGAIEVDHWVVEDQMGVRLLCKSDKKIRGCSFKTPYGKIYSDLSDGVFAERKRLQHITEEEGMDCGISISQILKKDEGDWECLMSFRVDGESVTESGKIVVAFAQAPSAVAPDPPFNVASVNLMEGKKTDIKVDHPDKLWVVEDQEDVRLLCKSDQKILGCSFQTPYGKIYSDLSDGIYADHKRLQHITEEEGMDCGISILQIFEEDEGDWECLMSFRVDGESITESGKIAVAFAQAPYTVALDPPFNVASVNLTEGKKTDVKCVATYARAKPTFRWVLGDENLDVEGKTQDVKVETEEDDVFNYQQTLSFVPDLSFNNKELKCVVKHIGLEYDRTAYVNLIVHNPEEIQESSLSTEEILDDMWAEIFLMRRDMDKMKSDLDEMMDNRLDKLLRQVEDLQTTSG